MGGVGGVNRHSRRSSAALAALVVAVVTAPGLTGSVPQASAASSGARVVGTPRKGACSQWDVTGTWQFKPYRGYTPILTVAVHDAKADPMGVIHLTGTLTLPGSQWQNAGWTGPSNSFTGDLIADKLTFLVPAPHRDGFVGLGKYTGTVTDGDIKGTSVDLNARDRGSVPWEATGTTTCVEFATDETSLSFVKEELGLNEPFNRYAEFCNSGQETLVSECDEDARTANIQVAAFKASYCPDESCTDARLNTYQQNVPNLIYSVTRLSLAMDGDKPLFPSVRLLRPVLEKLAVYSLQGQDKEAAQGAARTAWRLFSILAFLDDEAATESAQATSAAGATVVQPIALTRGTVREIGEQTPSGGDSASIGGVTLQPPKGWTVDESATDALILVERSAALEATPLRGPRITVRTVSDESVTDDQSDAPNEDALSGKVKVSKTSLHGQRAVVVEYTVITGGRPQTVRVVAMTPAAGVAYSFTLETPSTLRKRAVAALEAVLTTVEFEDAAAATGV